MFSKVRKWSSAGEPAPHPRGPVTLRLPGLPGCSRNFMCVNVCVHKKSLSHNICSSALFCPHIFLRGKDFDGILGLGPGPLRTAAPPSLWWGPCWGALRVWVPCTALLEAELPWKGPALSTDALRWAPGWAFVLRTQRFMPLSVSEAYFKLNSVQFAARLQLQLQSKEAKDVLLPLLLWVLRLPLRGRHGAVVSSCLLDTCTVPTMSRCHNTQDVVRPR